MSAATPTRATDLVTISGEPVWYDEPQHTRILARDLRVHLAHQRRYLGAIDVSVLAHLAITVQIAREWGCGNDILRRMAIHDAHEAFVGDVPTKLKKHLPGWAALELAWERRVHEAFALVLVDEVSPPVRRLVKEIDRAALWAEMDVWGHPGVTHIPQHFPGYFEQLDESRPGWRTPARWAASRLRYAISPDDYAWAILCNWLPELVLPGPVGGDRA